MGELFHELETIVISFEPRKPRISETRLSPPSAVASMPTPLDHDSFDKNGWALPPALVTTASWFRAGTILPSNAYTWHWSMVIFSHMKETWECLCALSDSSIDANYERIASNLRTKSLPQMPFWRRFVTYAQIVLKQNLTFDSLCPFYLDNENPNLWGVTIFP